MGVSSKQRILFGLLIFCLSSRITSPNYFIKFFFIETIGRNSYIGFLSYDTYTFASMNHYMLTHTLTKILGNNHLRKKIIKVLYDLCLVGKENVVLHCGRELYETFPRETLHTFAYPRKK